MTDAKTQPIGIAPVAVVVEQLDDNRAIIQWSFNPVPVSEILLWDHRDEMAPQQEASGEPTAETVKDLMLRTTCEDHAGRPGANLWQSSSVEEKVIALKVLKAYAGSRAAATAPARYFGPAAEGAVEMLLSMGYEYQQTSNGLAWVSTAPAGGVTREKAARWLGDAQRTTPYGIDQALHIAQAAVSDALTTAARAAEPAQQAEDAARYRCWRQHWFVDPDGHDDVSHLPDGVINAMTPEDLDAALDKLRGATPPVAARVAEPEGWKLVPVKPTPEMMQAAFEAYTKPLDGSAARIIAAHKAMLAAAPTPPTGTSKGEGK